jgi:hypothetical protein
LSHDLLAAQIGLLLAAAAWLQLDAQGIEG